MDNLTELLKNFNIKFLNEVHDLLKCAICKNVLIDACGAPCGCRFCWDCINQYLRDGGQSCPGTKDECSEIFLNTASELLKDPLTNTQISFLIAGCPNENCEYVCQLRKLPEHMRTCSKAAVECVFSYVGCADGLVGYDKMKEHFEESSVAHGRSLVGHIRNMENEIKDRMERYERALETLTAENSVFRQISEGNAAAVERIKQEIRVLSLNKESLARENTILKRELQTIREEAAMLRQRLDVCERRQGYADKQMLHIFDVNAAEMTKLKTEIRSLSYKNENDKSERRIVENDLRYRLEQHMEDIDTVRRMHEGVVGKLDRLSAAVSVVGLNDFVWRIKGISSKLNQFVDEYSRPFFSDGTRGYKMCLYYRMSSYDGLYLTFYLMRGDDDDRLHWPMSRVVLIDIIDEQCAVPVLSRRVCRATASERQWPEDRKKAYDRPDSDRNGCGDGFVFCVQYEKIKSTIGAILNDVLTVRCRVMFE